MQKNATVSFGQMQENSLPMAGSSTVYLRPFKNLLPSLSLISLLALPQPALAYWYAGTLDSTFSGDDNGTVTTDVTLDSNYQYLAGGVATQTSESTSLSGASLAVISGDKAKIVFAGLALNQGSAVDNHLSISGGEVVEAYGGYGTTADSNRVFIAGGSFSSADSTPYIAGGVASTGSLSRFRRRQDQVPCAQYSCPLHQPLLRSGPWP
ncbi:MAG: hypothetical protein K6F05_02210 [Succinivibrio sp.]|nr:hypothetical protein [Succinivibrio sp.]